MIEIVSHRGYTAHLLHGDSVALCNALPHWDALLTDPPYGIGFDSAGKKNARFAGVKVRGDAEQFDPRPWLEILDNRPALIFGANNFAPLMPVGGWLVWDKRCSAAADRIIGSPFELAWCSNPKLYAFARIQHGGVKNADGEGVKRVHPTQKPVVLMQRCLELLKIPAGSTILDPYMGSGTTGVAALRMGYNFVGVEIEEHNVEIAETRIRAEASRMSLL